MSATRDPARLLSRLASRISPEELKGHFVLGRTVHFRPEGWATRSLGGWDLAHARDLPVVELLDVEGTPLGWILGTPLLPGQGPLRDRSHLPFAQSHLDFERLFDAWLYRFAGQFAAILAGTIPRVYIDAYSSLPVLFDRELQLASSSPFLLTNDGTVPDDELQGQFDITRTGLWHILGTTPHARAERLLANHALHLDTWQQRRHWPVAALEPGEPEQLTDELCRLLGGTLEATAAIGSAPSVSLTAGGDTRAMLACSRQSVDRYRFFTVAFPDGPGTTDVRTAAQVASRAGIDYRLLRWVEPTDDDVDVFLYRTGCMIGERRGMRGGPSYAQLDPGAPYVSGVGGVLGVNLRDMHLTAAALDGAPIDGRTLVSRFGWPELPRLIERADRWLAELPPLDVLNIHHLFRVEMYFGCWGGPLALAYPDACCTTVYPFGQRGVIERLLRMPTGQRSDGSVRRVVVESCWPELLEVPVNRAPVSVAARRRVRRGASYARAGARRARLVALQLFGH